MRRRRELAALSGLAVRYAYGSLPPGPRPGDIIGGWGHKPTADRARRVAEERGAGYLAFEDGFLRSVRPGPDQAPLSMVIDRTGIYYDARQSCDLETRLNTGPDLIPDQSARARQAMDLLRSRQLSKYNDAAAPAPAADGGNVPAPETGRKRVLVVDQTFGDASVAGGLADQTSFEQMLDAACRENPDADILVKLHPEVVNGAKRGYFSALDDNTGVKLLNRKINPWALLSGISRVYTVSSQLGFEALMAGCEVTCFGMPFYAGWGLTDDRVTCPRRTRKVTLEELAYRVYFEYCRYFDAWRRTECDFFTAVDQLSFLRDHSQDNAAPVIGYRISLWKRKPISRMLGADPADIAWTRNPAEAISLAKSRSGRIIVWAREADTLRAPASAAGLDVLAIEDGFLRSVGLGVSFTPAASYVFDRRGIYYDPTGPSDIETLLEEGGFSEQLLTRAGALRRKIIDAGLSKYSLAAPPPQIADHRKGDIVLVPGQVADDQSILLGARGLYDDIPLNQGGANLGLLRAVRRRRPDAHIIYKPHPDVVAGLRNGRIARQQALELADQVIENASIHDLLGAVDAVETLTSLTGFEALLRAIPVTTHGRPFYAGWGLSEDLCDFPRRTRQISLDELVAGALLVYPRYYDPASGLPCPAEITLENLISSRASAPSPARWIRHVSGSGLAMSRRLYARIFG